jgi:hypothetical protein
LQHFPNGVANTWRATEGSMEALISAAARNDERAAREAIELRGATPAGDKTRCARNSPLYAAFEAGSIQVFNYLVDLADITCKYDGGRGMAVMVALISGCNGAKRAEKLQMLRTLLEKRGREALGVRILGGGTNSHLDPARMAIFHRDAAALDLILTAGDAFGKNQLFDHEEKVGGGSTKQLGNLLILGLSRMDVDVMLLLVNKWKILDGWKEHARYSDDDLRLAAHHISYICVDGYREGRADKVDALLRAFGERGFTPSFNRTRANSLLCLLYEDQGRCKLSESQAFRLLKVWHAAGFESRSCLEDPLKKGRLDYSLIIGAAACGQDSVLEWGINELKIPVDTPCATENTGPGGGDFKTTALVMALAEKEVKTALKLLRDHKAAPYYPDGTREEQPLHYLWMRHPDRLSDREAAEVLKAMLAVDRNILTASCWRKKAHGRLTAVKGPTPLNDVCKYGYVECLKILLDEDVPGAREMAIKPCVVGDESTYMAVYQSCAQEAAMRQQWQVLEILLTKCPEIELTKCYGPVEARRGPGPELPSVGEIVAEIGSRGSRPPRSTIMLLAAANQREMGMLQRQKASAERNATSNAPETSASEPERPLVAVVSSSAGLSEKRKARKREQKKKAKAKKRAAAAAGAGAGTAAAGDTDSDSSGEDEEEAGMDEEERMLARAPTFDLEKERAARKARAEGEEK